MENISPSPPVSSLEGSQAWGPELPWQRTKVPHTPHQPRVQWEFHTPKDFLFSHPVTHTQKGCDKNWLDLLVPTHIRLQRM